VTRPWELNLRQLEKMNSESGKNYQISFPSAIESLYFLKSQFEGIIERFYGSACLFLAGRSVCRIVNVSFFLRPSDRGRFDIFRRHHEPLSLRIRLFL